MTLSTKIEVFTDFTFVRNFAVGLHTCTAVAHSVCVSWAFLLYNVSLQSVRLVQ